MARRKGQGPGESRTSKRRLEAAQKQIKALELRKTGMEYHEIAKRVGYNSYQAAYQGVQSILEKTLQEPADEFRKVEGARLNALLKVAWPKALKGEIPYMEVVLKIHGQICKLYGLNKQIDINVQADQMNIQNNVQTNLTLRFDPKTLTEEQLGKCERLLGEWTSILTSVAEGSGRLEGEHPPGAGPAGNGHAP